jgi:hypothetical protein
MQPFTIKYYSRGSCPPISSFYVLSRGHNTGRPSYSPNANSFIFSCASQDLQKYYWLVYVLWYSRKFEDYLCGSVIEFIRVDDLKKSSQKPAGRWKILTKQLRRYKNFWCWKQN